MEDYLLKLKEYAKDDRNSAWLVFSSNVGVADNLSLDCYEGSTGSRPQGVYEAGRSQAESSSRRISCAKSRNTTRDPFWKVTGVSFCTCSQSLLNNHNLGIAPASTVLGMLYVPQATLTPCEQELSGGVHSGAFDERRCHPTQQRSSRKWVDSDEALPARLWWRSYKTPFELITSPSMPGRVSMAVRKAWARALKALSAL